MGDDASLEATEAELMQDLLTRKILMTNEIYEKEAPPAAPASARD